MVQRKRSDAVDFAQVPNVFDGWGEPGLRLQHGRNNVAMCQDGALG